MKLLTLTLGILIGCANSVTDATSTQSICTIEDQQNGTCGDTGGGGWEQVSPDSPEAQPTAAALYQIVNVELARCTTNYGRLRCCENTTHPLHERPQGWCCTTGFTYTTPPLCGFVADVTCALEWCDD
jgi:hypothetical protein